MKCNEAYCNLTSDIHTQRTHLRKPAQAKSKCWRNSSATCGPATISPSLQLYTHTTHARTHARIHTRTHTHTHFSRLNTHVCPQDTLKDLLKMININLFREFAAQEGPLSVPSFRIKAATGRVQPPSSLPPRRLSSDQ